MQFLWKYIDDLIGKGLEWSIIIELLWYSTITLIPLALPLAVLLASMMLTGKLSEKSELTAVNSLGQPFTYIISPLLLFSLLIGISSFVISNYSIPYANLKASTLMYDIMRKKLNINIQEKVFFTDIEGYSIRVDKKENNNILKDVIIYDYTDKKGIKKVFVAKSGKMSITKDNNYLLIELDHGQSYSDFINDEKEYILQTKFQKYNLALSLSSFQMERTTSDRFSNRARTMHINQLTMSLDSFQNDRSELENKILSSFKNYTKNPSLNKSLQHDHTTTNKHIKTQLENYISISSLRKLAENYRNQHNAITVKINKFYVELHRKLTLAIACLIMLLIGAPIGAIIKKGGFGLPVVFSIVLFLIYHIMSITGEKMVKKGVIEPLIGMWAPSIIMLIVGVILIIIVNNNYLERIWIKK
tara:strand:- start:3580 stop:4827 length:1248 start_codon:yes stop_codon:yes gene_type:complete